MAIPSDATQKIYEKAEERLRDLGGVYCEFNAEMILQYGPAHIVWSDDNLDDDSIKYCIGECCNHREGHPSSMPWEAIEVLKNSLNELLKIPYNERVLETEEVFRGE